MRRNNELFFVAIAAIVLLTIGVGGSKNAKAADTPPPPVIVESVPLGELHQLITLKLDTSINSMICFIVVPNPSKPVCWAQARGIVVSQGIQVAEAITDYSAIVDLAGRPDVLCLIQVVSGTVGESSITCAATV